MNSTKFVEHLQEVRIRPEDLLFLVMSLFTQVSIDEALTDQGPNPDGQNLHPSSTTSGAH